MNDTIRIMIVEDNQAFTESLKNMIKLSSNSTCVATFDNAEDCLSAFESNHAPEADIILLDLQLPGKNGMSLIPVLHQQAPKLRIIVLTQNDDYHTALEAIRIGVSGYLVKDLPIADIRSAISEIHNGGSVIDPVLSQAVLTVLNSKNFIDNNPLSPQERKVLELMAMGYVKKEVADSLELSYSAVALYTQNIYKKLQAPNITAAVASAIRKGLI